MTKFAWPAAVSGAIGIVAIAGCSVFGSPVSQTSAVPSTGSPGAPASSAPPVTSAPPATSQPPATSPAPPPTSFTVCMTPVITCSGEMRTEPTDIEVSGDGSGFVAGVTWTGWGAATAQGNGTLNVNNCVPNCAQGKLTGYPATITLSALTPYATGLQAYADMTISAPADNYDETYTKLLPSS